MINNYPQTSMQDMNLDWIIAEVKELAQNWASKSENWDKWQKDTNEAFADLKSYVMNYFDNLDVQNEINNKLDEMYNNGDIAKLFTGYVTPQMFGAIGDGKTDDTEAFIKAFETSLPILLISDYKINNITLENVEIYGCNNTLISNEIELKHNIKVSNTNFTTYNTTLFKYNSINEASDSSVLNHYFNNCIFTNNNNNGDIFLYHLYNGKGFFDVTIENSNFCGRCNSAFHITSEQNIESRNWFTGFIINNAKCVNNSYLKYFIKIDESNKTENIIDNGFYTFHVFNLLFQYTDNCIYPIEGRWLTKSTFNGVIYDANGEIINLTNNSNSILVELSNKFDNVNDAIKITDDGYIERQIIAYNNLGTTPFFNFTGDTSGKIWNGGAKSALPRVIPWGDDNGNGFRICSFSDFNELRVVFSPYTAFIKSSGYPSISDAEFITSLHGLNGNNTKRYSYTSITDSGLWFWDTTDNKPYIKGPDGWYTIDGWKKV